jgi:hypothetical protein
MKNIFNYLLLVFGFVVVCSCACQKSKTSGTEIVSQNSTYLVKPLETDKNYTATEESHYVSRNSTKHLNKLLLFIGGSYSVPKDYYIFCQHAATQGFDVISLSYPNTIATAPLGSSSDQYIFDNYRDEICFGNQVSNVVIVDALNCINTRTIKLIQFLKVTYPNENWQQYLTAQNTLQWNKVIVAGHSQGSGHACYLGKKNLVDRVLMFSGPNDYSGYYSAAANWLTQTGATPLNNQFSLLHVQDEIVPFANQVANLRGLGLLSSSQNPVIIDAIPAPYGNVRSLSTNIQAMSFHSSTIGGNTILPNVWTYMLTTN